jgi:hypothetical protein
VAHVPPAVEMKAMVFSKWQGTHSSWHFFNSDSIRAHDQEKIL